MRVGGIPEHGASLQDFKHHMINWQNVKESCAFKKIYDVGKAKLQTKLTCRHEKTKFSIKS